MGVAGFAALLISLFFLVFLISLILFLLAKRKWRDKGNNGSSQETTAYPNQAGPGNSTGTITESEEVYAYPDAHPYAYPNAYPYAYPYFYPNVTAATNNPDTEVSTYIEFDSNEAPVQALTLTLTRNGRSSSERKKRKKNHEYFSLVAPCPAELSPGKVGPKTTANTYWILFSHDTTNKTIYRNNTSTSSYTEKVG